MWIYLIVSSILLLTISISIYILSIENNYVRILNLFGNNFITNLYFLYSSIVT